MKNCKYFGTDGIRGKVGILPITPSFILKLGWAAGKVLSKRNGSKTVLIGKDTRLSGYMLESALEAGLAAAGVTGIFTGPIPTPAIAYLTRVFPVEAGIVISASHNQFDDNGIKFFSSKGTKLSNKLEKKIELEIEKPINCVKSGLLGRANRIVDAARKYIDFCKSTFPSELNLNKLNIVVDCANGATYHIAPNILRELGAIVTAISIKPNGLNINKKCGTTYMKNLQDLVVEKKADIGLAYDGDGDRVIMVDHLGSIVDGDQILYIIVRENLRQGKLNGGVVGTLMSNMGIQLAFKKLGIPFVRAKVGDRYVLEKMQERGWLFGAENSGHIILSNQTTTGDGIISSLQVLTVMIRNKLKLRDLCSEIKMLPQVLINLRFLGKHDPLDDNNVKKAILKAKKILSNCGRILLRKSGTEPLIRIMVEGENKKNIIKLANSIADKIKSI